MKKIALGVSFLAASLGAAPAWATDIKVAVAANFSDALTALTTAYGLAGWSYSSTSTFTVTSGATATLASNISTPLSSGGTTPYDLFFSADDTTPAALKTSFPTPVQTPFFYAEGKLVLWAKYGPNVSASGYNGFPSPGAYSYANGQVAIANPATAPYGTAAQQVLSRVHSITYPGGAHDAKFTQYSTIGTTYAAVNGSTSTSYPNMGFVAKSSLCDPATSTYRTGITGTYYEYTPATVNGNPPHDRLLQHAVAIQGRPGASVSAVNDFASYVASTAGKAVIAKYCYGTTP